MKLFVRNTNQAKLILTLVTIAFCISGVFSDANAKGLSTNACNRDIVQTYSLTGVDIPIIEKIEMCPKIVRSCCLKQDQPILFTNFIHGGEDQTVIDHYSRVVGTYNNLIEKLVDVQEFAKTVKNNIIKKIANCKLLAERILNYEVSQVAEQVRQNLAKLDEFFQTAYSGFYCTICDFDNHKFFDATTQTIFYSDKFCRDIIEHTLPSLLLFHVDIVKHLNLVTKFVTSCDFSGTYNLDAVFPANYTFAVVNEVMQDLQSCRDNRNKREWFSYCKDICINFKISSFSDYFQPNFKLISSYTTFLTTSLNSLTAAQGARSFLGALASPTSGAKRILEEENKKTSIFNMGLSAKVNFESWTADFLTYGINLYEAGQESIITDQTYQSVKVFLQISNQNANQVFSNNKPTGRKLNSSSIMNIVFGIMALFVTLLK